MFEKTENIKKNNFKNEDIYNQTDQYIELKNIASSHNEINNDNYKLTIGDKDSIDLSRYKITKLFGIKFYHIGNTYTFGFFNKFSEPLFCIDNRWYFHLIIYFIEIALYYAGNYFLFRKLENWKQFVYNLLLFTIFVFYTQVILMNPGIVIKNKKNSKMSQYCTDCNLFYNKEDNITHCKSCNVCIKKVDHHCNVIRKCITRRNIIIFFLMVINYIVVYTYSVIIFIFYIIDNYKKIKKS